ncbi:MAG: Fic family protein [Nanoarchaeota archaeon]
MLNKTLLEIDGIVSRVNTHPEYSGCVAREKYHFLREEAAEHSLDIELASDRKKLTGKQRELFLQRIGRAQEFLAQSGLSMYSLSRLGSIIEPEANPSGGFRNLEVSFGDFYGIKPATLHYEVKDLLDFLSASDSHPVVRAAQAHVELVRIHPYGDGNGRVARLLQNFCLQQRNYPPAIIPSDNRDKYINLMRTVLQDRVKGKGSLFDPSVRETEFYDFVAQEVLSSAKQLEDELRVKRIYHVNLTNVHDPRTVGTIASILRNAGRRPGSKGVNVLINKKNGHKRGESLKVVGDIGRDELVHDLEKFCPKYRIHFVIEDRFC